MVFYRKYRPQTLDELDNALARESLRAILSRNSDVHAFLFMGPKGLGKTSSARIVAKVLNCTGRTTNKKQLTTNKKKESKNKSSVVSGQLSNVSSIEPCNKCSQCISITAGSSMDVIEIDGASNRGIDQIRDLKERIKLSPASARKKVYIIDEVHMLTQEAFDALLKTLEEPPAHVVFILCTTEPQKIPSTISSRCFEVTFAKATNEEIARSLLRISKAEKLKVDKDALEAIAERSDGSFRDASKILEEISVYSQDITRDEVEKRYKSQNINAYAVSLLVALKAKNAREALSIVSATVGQGQDIKHFTEKLIEILHKILLVNVGIEKENVGVEFNMEEIKELVQVFTKAHSELRFAVIPQLPLEVAIIEYVSNGDQNGAGELTHAPRDTRPTSSENQPNSRSLSGSLSSDSDSKKSRPASDSLVGGKLAGLKEGGLLEQLIKEVGKENKSLAGVLRSCTVEELASLSRSGSGSKVTLSTKYKFHAERLEDKESMALLENIASKITGKKVKVQIILKNS